MCVANPLSRDEYLRCCLSQFRGLATIAEKHRCIPVLAGDHQADGAYIAWENRRSHGSRPHSRRGPIQRSGFAPVVKNGRTFMVCAVPHFASRTRAWSSASGSIEALGAHLREVVNHPFAREETSGVPNSSVNSHGVGHLVSRN